MTDWASGYISKLQAGETVKFRPRGNSMSGRIESGQLVTMEPIADLKIIKVDDIVLCRCAGANYLHLVRAVNSDGRLLIGNNKGRENGWTRTVYGRLIGVAP